MFKKALTILSFSCSSFSSPHPTRDPPIPLRNAQRSIRVKARTGPPGFFKR